MRSLLKSLTAWLGKAGSRRQPHHTIRFSLECLEDRTTPTILTAGSFLDEDSSAGLAGTLAGPECGPADVTAFGPCSVDDTVRQIDGEMSPGADSARHLAAVDAVMAELACNGAWPCAPWRDGVVNWLAVADDNSAGGGAGFGEDDRRGRARRA
jgi:hypothetical protein